ncbi:hypothetical protein INT45_000601 [Circinella minor]|uniref:Velvet domain-containing protein n=1 Tax=Circinella minor TaxID=1195481 RepID=A0A8H7VRT8_9FUNG|nr:hypothetical protein INT45_000601 [Circinella minor]
MNITKLTDTNNTCTYRFLSSSLADLPEDRDYYLTIRQQPRQAKVCAGTSLLERRYPIEPAPILQSPFYFAVVNVVDVNYHHHSTHPPKMLENHLVGTTVSSLHRLRDMNNTDGGFFVFGDLSVRKEGNYKLHFSLFEIVEGVVQNGKTVLSDIFSVYATKNFPGPLETTFLSRIFSDQGVKIRIRKENRLQASANLRKRRLEVQALMDNSSSPTVDLIHHQQYQSNEKRFKEVVEDEGFPPPPYAAMKTDVYFGKWQATTTPISSTSAIPLLAAPPSPPKSVTTSPISSPPMPSLVHHKEWGERLPPLRAIMTDALIYDRTLPPLRR